MHEQKLYILRLFRLVGVTIQHSFTPGLNHTISTDLSHHIESRPGCVHTLFKYFGCSPFF